MLVETVQDFMRMYAFICAKTGHLVVRYYVHGEFGYRENRYEILPGHLRRIT